MERHVTLLGVLYVAFSALGILIGLGVYVAMIGLGLVSGDPSAEYAMSRVAPVVGFSIVVLSLPGIIGAIGLLRYHPWARYLILVLGGISVINVPIGTALGVYTFWVLLQDETARLFTRSAQVERGGDPQP